MGTGPLRGLKVVDISGAVAGPWVSSHLAEQGADVILIEKVGVPDVMRVTGALVGEQKRPRPRYPNGNRLQYFEATCLDCRCFYSKF